MPLRAVIIGCGDHARVVADVLRTLGVTVVGCVTAGAGRRDVGVATPPGTWLGDLDDPASWLSEATLDGFVAAIGTNEIRARAFERAVALGLAPISAVHPSSVVLTGARIHPGAQVCAGAIVGIDAVIEENAVVNTGATIDHDCHVARHAFVAPGAHLAGRVEVGAGAFVGIGATVVEGVRIGRGALVAAGAAVVADVAEGARVAGVPAAPMRTAEGR